MRTSRAPALGWTSDRHVGLRDPSLAAHPAGRHVTATGGKKNISGMQFVDGRWIDSDTNAADFATWTTRDAEPDRPRSAPGLKWKPSLQRGAFSLK
ncbi:hypothetical protein EJ110_NYTH34748 [Nymphaea thermarum]|nr:hypothetical protein EJ110_NYTH34748 [Nymphaea thermarum]